MKIAYIGHYSPCDELLLSKASAAGNQVQLQIISEMADVFNQDEINCFVMAPASFWPIGPLQKKSSVSGTVNYIGYLNVPILKHVIFASRLFLRLIKFRPTLCVQYNAYLFENIALLFLRAIGRTTILVIIVQDIFFNKNGNIFSKNTLKKVPGNLSLFLVKFFDIIVPISREIILDFNLKENKCIVFQGGPTKFANELLKMRWCKKPEEIGVFAGALEAYNGVDLLVEQWIKDQIPYVLHIFGSGQLEHYLQRISTQSRYIIFHGLQSEEVVLSWQKKAQWNFCFRFSIGINEKYFFPSKLFNIMCAPGIVVSNNFHGIPKYLVNYICIISDDFSDLYKRISSASNLHNRNDLCTRRNEVKYNNSWNSCIKKIKLNYLYLLKNHTI